MSAAVIVDAVRTQLAKGKPSGSYADVHPVDLHAQALSALLERTGIDPAVVDDVISGGVGQIGEQSGNTARWAVLGAGFPESVPGVTVDRQRGSSQQALHFAARGVMAGAYDVLIASEVESMSRIPIRPQFQGRTSPEAGLASCARNTRAHMTGCSPTSPTPGMSPQQRWVAKSLQYPMVDLGSADHRSWPWMLILRALGLGVLGSGAAAAVILVRPGEPRRPSPAFVERIGQLQAMLDRARDRGEPAPTVAELLEIVVASLYFQALFATPMAIHEVERFVDRLLELTIERERQS